MHDKAPGVTPDSAAIISASDVQLGHKVHAKIKALRSSEPERAVPALEKRGRPGEFRIKRDSNRFTCH